MGIDAGKENTAASGSDVPVDTGSSSSDRPDPGAGGEPKSETGDNRPTPEQGSDAGAKGVTTDAKSVGEGGEPKSSSTGASTESLKEQSGAPGDRPSAPGGHGDTNTPAPSPEQGGNANNPKPVTPVSGTAPAPVDQQKSEPKPKPGGKSPIGTYEGIFARRKRQRIEAEAAAAQRQTT